MPTNRSPRLWWPSSSSLFKQKISSSFRSVFIRSMLLVHLPLSMQVTECIIHQWNKNSYSYELSLFERSLLTKAIQVWYFTTVRWQLCTLCTISPIHRGFGRRFLLWALGVELPCHLVMGSLRQKGGFDQKNKLINVVYRVGSPDIHTQCWTSKEATFGAEVFTSLNGIVIVPKKSMWTITWP